MMPFAAWPYLRLKYPVDRSSYVSIPQYRLSRDLTCAMAVIVQWTKDAAPLLEALLIQRPGSPSVGVPTVCVVKK